MPEFAELTPVRVWIRFVTLSLSMSEYWVSKKKYICKYCDIFIADDAPSRQQHENGLRHKGNVERYIRGIYKAGEKHKKDLEEEKREIKRVEQAANAAFAQDVGAGLAKATCAPVASSSNVPKKPVPKPSNPFTNYSTAQSLGYEDPDAEKIAAQLELRQSQGVAGDWQIITPQAPVPSSSSTLPTAAAEADNDHDLKREAEAPPEEDSRSFKLRKKTLNPGLGEIYDPGVIPIKVKKKEVEETKSTAPSLTSGVQPALPKWTTLQLKHPGQSQDAIGQDDSSLNGVNGENSIATSMIETGFSPALSSKWAKPQWSTPLPDIKLEERGKIFGLTEGPTDVTEDPPTGQGPEPKMELNIKAEDDQPPLRSDPLLGSLFKKRKTPAGTARGRRQI